MNNNCVSIKAKGSFFLGSERNPVFEIRDMVFDNIGEKDVLVRNMACGVCGTDVHIYHGEKGSAEVTPPVVLGHEYSGIVVKVGTKVDRIKVGDHVAIDPNMYCGNCVPCRMGHKQNCEHLYALGVNTNGGFAEYSLCPESQCFIINKDVDFTVAAMVEPLACVLHGIDRAEIKHGQNVLIIGGGPIGLMMTQMAKLAGAAVVILSEPVQLRREIGLEVGADYAVDPINEDLTAAIEKYTGRRGVDVVIECVGKNASVQQAFEAADSGANIVLFSVPSPGSEYPLPLFDMFKKELTVKGCIINPDTHLRAVNLINSGRVIIKPLITHTYSIDELEEAIKMQQSAESIKVMILPGNKQ